MWQNELSVNDLVKLSGLSDRQVRRVLIEGKTIHGRRVDGRWRVSRDEARRWLSERGYDSALQDDTVSRRFDVSSPELWQWLQSQQDTDEPIPLEDELPSLCEFLASEAPDENLYGYWGGIGWYAAHVLANLHPIPAQDQPMRVPALFKLPKEKENLYYWFESGEKLRAQMRQG